MRPHSRCEHAPRRPDLQNTPPPTSSTPRWPMLEAVLVQSARVGWHLDASTAAGHACNRCLKAPARVRPMSTARSVQPTSLVRIRCSQSHSPVRSPCDVQLYWAKASQQQVHELSLCTQASALHCQAQRTKQENVKPTYRQTLSFARSGHMRVAGRASTRPRVCTLCRQPCFEQDGPCRAVKPQCWSKLGQSVFLASYLPRGPHVGNQRRLNGRAALRAAGERCAGPSPPKSQPKDWCWIVFPIPTVRRQHL